MTEDIITRNQFQARWVYPYMVLHCDSDLAIKRIKNPIHHEKRKHIGVARHFIREKIKGQHFIHAYTNINDQIAHELDGFEWFNGGWKSGLDG